MSNKMATTTTTTNKYVIEFIWRYYVYIRLWMGELLFGVFWIWLACCWHLCVCECVFRVTWRHSLTPSQQLKVIKSDFISNKCVYSLFVKHFKFGALCLMIQNPYRKKSITKRAHILPCRASFSVAQTKEILMTYTRAQKN